MDKISKSILLSPITAHFIPFGVVLLFMAFFENLPFHHHWKGSLNTVLLYIYSPFLIVYLSLLKILKDAPKREIEKQRIAFSKYLRAMAYFLLLISVIEIVDFGGLPLLNIFTGLPALHSEFGIPTLHGFANMVYFILLSYCLHNFLKGKGNGRYIIILLLWPILLVSRGMFMIALLVAGYHYVASKRFRLSSAILFFLVVGIANYFLFGLLGQSRASFDMSEALGTDRETSIYFLWFYVYLVSPLANLQNTIDTIYLESNGFPLATVLPIIPSVLKSIFGLDFTFGTYSGIMVEKFLNASTGFMAPYLDLKHLGIVVLSAFYGFISAIVKYRSLNGSAFSICLLNTLLVLNIFNINFFSIPFLLSLILLYWLDRRIII